MDGRPLYAGAGFEDLVDVGRAGLEVNRDEMIPGAFDDDVEVAGADEVDGPAVEYCWTGRAGRGAGAGLETGACFFAGGGIEICVSVRACGCVCGCGGRDAVIEGLGLVTGGLAAC